MTKLNSRQIEYLHPLLDSVENRIKILQGRLNDRHPENWSITEFRLMANNARSIADDLTWIDTAVSVIRDVEEGEY